MSPYLRIRSNKAATDLNAEKLGKPNIFWTLVHQCQVQARLAQQHTVLLCLRLQLLLPCTEFIPAKIMLSVKSKQK
jgi:hypothetical protein